MRKNHSIPRIKRQPDGGWSVILGCGKVAHTNLTNAQAWREIDKLSGDALSASEAAKDYKERLPELPAQEMQDFYSGLIQIGIDRGYADGWAWHKFHERFKHGPEGLSNLPCKPSKSVWGWLNRKAISASKGARS